MFDSDEAMVRIDMSELWRNTRCLVWLVRLRDMSVIRRWLPDRSCASSSVFRHTADEVEKAHPDVFNILLQVLDDVV